MRLETDFLDICESMLTGTLIETKIQWRPGSSACVVLASENYPAAPRTGDAIAGLAEAAAIPNVQIFHAGTAESADRSIVTSGGRVLGVTATGATLDESLAMAYSAVEKISWPGMQYRWDIGK